MALTSPQRAQVWANLQSRWSREFAKVSITKAEGRAALDALDDYLDANAVAINNALPAAAKSGLTAAQKARLLSEVALARYQES